MRSLLVCAIALAAMTAAAAAGPSRMSDDQLGAIVDTASGEGAADHAPADGLAGKGRAAPKPAAANVPTAGKAHAGQGKVAASSADSAARPPAPAAASAASGHDFAALLRQRGDATLATGDVAGARLFYRRAADEGDSRAMLALARTYDAAFLAQIKVLGVRPEPEKAAHWYDMAAALEAARSGNRTSPSSGSAVTAASSEAWGSAADVADAFATGTLPYEQAAKILRERGWPMAALPPQGGGAPRTYLGDSVLDGNKVHIYRNADGSYYGEPY